MYCGDYADSCKGKYYYVAVNMHWEDHEFALPKLPKKKKWKELFTTSNKGNADSVKKELTADAVNVIEKRSITVFIGE